jgi:vacuolar-type H+-ATPase subunit H
MADKKDSLQAAQACNRDVPTDAPGPKQDCSDVVNISVFFDGTGNNKDVDDSDHKWSNPARMWLAAVQRKEQTNYPIYISGVGTPFNNTATKGLEKWWIDKEDGLPGNVSGAGGSRRLDFGQDNINSTLRQVLLNNAKKLRVTTKAYSDDGRSKSLGELNTALGKHRLIKMINLSIFGFSRGAALARAFSNDFLSLCETDGQGQKTYNGFPIRIHFVGLFDTVASFGIPATNMDWPWTEKKLKIPGEVERCVHYVAAHELRFSFPSDLIRDHGRLMPNWTETVYPGVHSDVGGGYLPLNKDTKDKPDDYAATQGLSNNYARIPMHDMMNEAVKVGVRMLAYDDIEKINAPLFDERFAIEPKALDDFRHYMAAVPAGKTTEETVTAHMKALYSAYGTMTRKGMKTPDKVASAGSVKNALFGHVGMASEVGALQHRGKAAKLLVEQANLPHILQFYGTTYSQVVRPEAWRLQAWDSDANDAIVTFIKYWVHDSKAGFINSVEPFSYFRGRGMSESTRNVLAKGLQWFDENVEAITGGVIKIYHSAEGVVVETWKQGVLTATQTYKVGEKFTIDTVNAGEKYAVEVYQTSKQVVISTVDAGQKMIVTSINTAQKKAAELADAAQKKAAEVGQQIEQGAKQAAKEAGQAYDAAQKSASDMATQLGQGAKQVSDAIGSKVDAGMKAVEDGWKATRANLGF